MSVTILAEINFMYHYAADKDNPIDFSLFSDEWQDSKCLSVNAGDYGDF